MKVVLEYDLPEDDEDFKIALKGIKYYCAINDIREAFRKKTKYESDGMSEEEYKTWEKAKEVFWEMLRDNEVADDF